eukprot:TRINITY_DN10614_c0_g1_i1.p1 TRINITY_DN10614_c0_g1~~TRINITY_DN10614_c0_g1_i1.p1  ORF type:complete len:888 (+),score=117.88 TRINITY_DN10614_c0_g1_i1:159-2666(+)
MEVTETDCTALAGAFNRDESCPRGVCDYGDGYCVTNVLSCDCAAPGAIFDPLGTCEEGICVDDNECCTITTQGACPTEIQGISVCPPPTPGHCMVNGTCKDISKCDCSKIGGTFQSGPFCSSLSTGSCQYSACDCEDDVLQSECTHTFSGVWEKDGSCTSSRGSCLDTSVCDGVCYDDFTQCDCDRLGGAFSALSCKAVAPVSAVGACTNAGVNDALCFAGKQCHITTECECDRLGKRYVGDGTACPSCIGACCHDTKACTTLTKSTCEGAYGGVFLGVNSKCSDCNGGCCDMTAKTCTRVPAPQCKHTFAGHNTTCKSCKFGACCPANSLDSCSIELPADCTRASGKKYRGDGTTCATPCPKGACCSEVGGTCRSEREEGECIVRWLSEKSWFVGEETKCRAQNPCGSCEGLSLDNCTDTEVVNVRLCKCVCPANKKFRCADGSCAENVEECAEMDLANQGCPLGTFACPADQCVSPPCCFPFPTACSKSNAQQCIGRIACPYGNTCADRAQDCPPVPGCPDLYFGCPDSTCKKDPADCFGNRTCEEGFVLCPDQVCRPVGQSCPSVNGCGFGKVLCATGVCVDTVAECACKQENGQSGWTCWSGECVGHIRDCKVKAPITEDVTGVEVVTEEGEEDATVPITGLDKTPLGSVTIVGKANSDIEIKITGRPLSEKEGVDARGPIVNIKTYGNVDNDLNIKFPVHQLGTDRNGHFELFQFISDGQGGGTWQDVGPVQLSGSGDDLIASAIVHSDPESTGGLEDRTFGVLFQSSGSEDGGDGDGSENTIAAIVVPIVLVAAVAFVILAVAGVTIFLLLRRRSQARLLSRMGKADEP